MIRQQEHIEAVSQESLLELRSPHWPSWLTGVAGCQEAVDTRSARRRKFSRSPSSGPALASVHWTVQQPADIEAFEQTPIVPKIPGYVQKWNVDIGDHVKKGDTLAVLWVPDMVAELNQRKAEVQQARKLIEVAEAHLASTAAQVEEARAGVAPGRAEAQYCKLQYDRITQLTDSSVINKQVKDESWNRLESAEAGVKEAEAKIVRSEADVKESEAARNKSGVDVDVAQAAPGEDAGLGELSTLTAPFDGVVTRRNINTGDFVKPPGAVEEAPLYVVERRDLMRIFVEVPEADAVWVKVGYSRPHPACRSFGTEQYCGTVKRMAYSLKRQSRTLLAEIDLPNPEDLLRPGMYAYAAIQVERANVLTLPASAVATRGNVNEGYQDFCFLCVTARSGAHPSRWARGVGRRVQVLKKQVNGAWHDFNERRTGCPGRARLPGRRSGRQRRGEVGRADPNLARTAHAAHGEVKNAIAAVDFTLHSTELGRAHYRPALRHSRVATARVEHEFNLTQPFVPSAAPATTASVCSPFETPLVASRPAPVAVAARVAD